MTIAIAGFTSIYYFIQLVRRILITGLIAGALDIAAALINAFIANGTKPARVFQFIASGLFGQEAFASDVMVLWGFLFHFCIALSWTAVYFILYPKIRPIATRPAVAGVCFGIFVWVAMNYLILPLTLVPKFPFDFFRAMTGASILIIAVGIPVAWSAHKYYSPR